MSTNHIWRTWYFQCPVTVVTACLWSRRRGTRSPTPSAPSSSPTSSDSRLQTRMTPVPEPTVRRRRTRSRLRNIQWLWRYERRTPPTRCRPENENLTCWRTAVVRRMSAKRCRHTKKILTKASNLKLPHVDIEFGRNQQTETLKLLFILPFSNFPCNSFVSRLLLLQNLWIFQFYSMFLLFAKMEDWNNAKNEDWWT